MSKSSIAATALAVGCGLSTPPARTSEDAASDSMGSVGDTGGPMGNTGSDGAGSDGGTSGGPGDSGPPATTGPNVRCGKIDLVFVVEQPGNLEGWWEYQSWYSKLALGFATLISELYVTVDVQDLRVMFVPSTPYALNYSCAPSPDGNPCPNVIFDECDATLGAGSNGSEIPEWGRPECMSGRYFESATDDLQSTFSCVLYGQGLDEDGTGPVVADADDTLMTALTQAVSQIGGAAQCNEGFVRDDALLVVALLALDTDARPDSSPGDSIAWVDALTDAKSGSDDNIVVLALGPDADQPGALCSEAQTPQWPATLREFTQNFANSVWNSACLPDYSPFFAKAAELIDQACEDFVPEG